LTGKIDKNEPEVIAEMERVNKKLLSLNSQPSTILTTGFILEEELPIAYAGASLYAIPSLSEGFGWPPLEAMACGTPVISSNISCMPEILGYAPCYFDPYDIDDIAAAISKVLSDQKLSNDLREKGLQRAKIYDWNKTASATFKVYKRALGVE
jgi:glycosyltransferase involved in cell wall biosynthesis